MTRIAVVSSHIVSIGFDPETEELEVEFKPRKDGVAPIWRYDHVTSEWHEQLMTAESVGRAFKVFLESHPGRRVADEVKHA